MLQRFQRKPTFPLDLESVLDTLYETPEVPKIPSPLERNSEFPTTSKEEPRFPRLN